MTTPQRLRRRQRIESAWLAILGLCLVLSVVYFRHEDSAQKMCLTSQVRSLTDSLSARGVANQADSDSTSRVILAVAGAKTKADVREALATYARTQAQIDQDRRDHPVPAFPTGACN